MCPVKIPLPKLMRHWREREFAEKLNPPVYRAGIDPAIGVPADRGVDRTMVHARRAANATKHVLELAAEECAAAVVEQHDMILLRPVEILRPPRAGRYRRIGRELLASGRARQEAQQGCRVL